jgi:hypothetical protein
MADAWTAPVGERPVQPDIASIIRNAQNSSDHVVEDGMDGSQVGLEGVSFRHTEVSASASGGSSLGKDALGSAALSAALTLHPSVFISGIGDASIEVIQSMLSTVGPCSVRLETDEESGKPTGEAEATFTSAEKAIEAIRRYDGSRFDDGYLRVSVSRRAAQGSLTTRGKGGGKGGGKGRKGGGIAFSERQKDLIYDQRMQLQQEELDAFKRARAAQRATGGGRGLGDGRGASSSSSLGFGESSSVAAASGRGGGGAAAAAASKKRKLGGGPALPGVLVVKTAASASRLGGDEAWGGGSAGRPAVPPAPAPAPVELGPAPKPEPASGGGLLGLAGYGSSSEEGED